MGLLLKQIFAFFRLLNSDTGTNQLASGLAFGIVLGFSPFLSLQSLLVILILFFFRVQMGAAFLSGFFFKLVAFLIDPVSYQLGSFILESEMLRPTFVQLYNMPLVPLTRFYNSIVMGSGVIGFVLAIPAFFGFKKLIIQYRETILSRFKESKIWKAFAATKFYGLYLKYLSLYGG